MLDIGDFEVKPNPAIVDEGLRGRLQRTIDRLHLNEPTFCEARREYHDRYHGLRTEAHDPEQPYPLWWLEHECPFVAGELRRQRRLRPGDV